MTDPTQLGKLIIVAGRGLILIGILLLIVGRISFFGYLSGDFVYQR